ncbi:hypothetical protein LguiB_001781 [Lonicera macranthoides]
MRDQEPRGGTRTSSLSSEIEELRFAIARMQQELEREAEERERYAEEMRQFWAKQHRAMEEMQAQVWLLLKGNASGGEFTFKQQP